MPLINQSLKQLTLLATLTLLSASLSAEDHHPLSTRQYNLFENQSHTAPQTQPSFEVVSIRPVAPGATVSDVGFHSLPGGRIEINGFGVKQLISEAFHVPTGQIKGGPDWLNTEAYVITAIPPNRSASNATIQQYESSAPTEQQREMLQTMLAERFSLRYHEELRPGSVFVLTRNDCPLKMQSPKDGSRKPAFVLFMRGDVFDGEARAANVSMPDLVAELSFDLGVPVVDKTGLTGSYDFHVEPFAPDNKDAEFAAIGAMRRLGLKLQKAASTARVIVIDNIQKPTPN